MKCKKYVKMKQLRKYSSSTDTYKVRKFEWLLKTLDEIVSTIGENMFSYEVVKTCEWGEEISFIFIAKNKMVMRAAINKITLLCLESYEMRFDCARYEL